MRIGRIARFVVSLLLTALCPSGATGKCAAARYAVSGVVHERASGEPLPNAVATLLVDGRDPDRWEASDVRPLTAQTAKDGTYNLVFYFDTIRSYSWLTGHDCSGQPKSISVVISKPGYTTERMAVLIGSPTDASLDRKLIAPSCALKRSL
jgi:hypothetical protein